MYNTCMYTYNLKYIHRRTLTYTNIYIYIYIYIYTIFHKLSYLQRIYYSIEWNCIYLNKLLLV